MGKNNKRFTFDEVKHIFECNGYRLVSKEYVNSVTNLTIEDSEGYLYYTCVGHFNRKGSKSRLCKFHTSNIHSWQNLNNFVRINYPDFRLHGSEYINMFQRVVLETKEGYKCDIEIKQLVKGVKLLMFLTYNPYALDNLKIFVKSVLPDFEVLTDKYKGVHSEFKLKDSLGYEYVCTKLIIGAGNKPSKFHPSNPYSIENIKKWIVLNKREIELISTEYKGGKTPLEWKCLKHDCMSVFKSNFDSIQRAHGCSYCAGKKFNSTNNLASSYPNLIKEWHVTKNKKYNPNNIGAFSNKKVWWICIKCSHEWKSTVANRTASSSGCPMCYSVPKSEHACLCILNKYNIENIMQYRFKNCRSINTLPFDFYLPKYNKVVELNGLQHYEPVEYFGGKEKFEKQQKHDQIKRNYCQENNIRLIEIPYWDFDNIEEILIRELGLDVKSVVNT